MTEIEYRISDLINFSSNQKPVEFENAFKGILAQKVSSAIEDRKQQIASSLISVPREDEEIDQESPEEELHGEVA